MADTKTKSELYKQWVDNLPELKAAIIDKLDDYELPAIETRVSNFVDSLGDELMRAASAEQYPAPKPKSE